VSVTVNGRAAATESFVGELQRNSRAALVTSATVTSDKGKAATSLAFTIYTAGKS